MSTCVRCYIGIVAGPAHLVISIVVIMVLFDVLLNVIVLKVITVIVRKFVRFLLFHAVGLSGGWGHRRGRMIGALRLL